MEGGGGVEVLVEGLVRGWAEGAGRAGGTYCYEERVGGFPGHYERREVGEVQGEWFLGLRMLGWGIGGGRL